MEKSSSESEVSPTSSKPSTEGMERTGSEYIRSPKGSKDSEVKEQSREAESISSAKEVNEGIAEEVESFKLLKRKIGLDVCVKAWIKAHPELASKHKSELITRLKNELYLVKNGDYDTNSDFDTIRIFELLTVINDLMEQSDRKNFIEFVCKVGSSQFLEKICQQEMKDAGGKVNLIKTQYPWKGNFTGYTKLLDLLQYVIDNRCSSEIVLCIAEKIYGTLHNVYNGTQFIEHSQVKSMQERLNQPSQVVEECLKKAIELGNKDAVLAALGGDIYHCIRLKKKEKFEMIPEFLEAYSVIKEAVIDVMSSWVENEKRKRYFKGYVQRLLNQGIKIDMTKIRKEDLIDELESLGIEIKGRRNFSKEKLIKRLKEEIGQQEAGKLRLRKVVVGTFISLLFFKYPNKVIEVIKGESFELKTTPWEKSEKLKECDQLNAKINSGKSAVDVVLRFIELLNSSSHKSNGWFFREVLTKIVNEKLDKLQAVCTAICKEPMQELLMGEKVHENVIDVLKFIGVEKYSLTLENTDQSISIVPENSDNALVTNSQSVEEPLASSKSRSETRASNNFLTSDIALSSRQSSANTKLESNNFAFTSCGSQKISTPVPNVNQGGGGSKPLLNDPRTGTVAKDKMTQFLSLVPPGSRASERGMRRVNLQLADRRKKGRKSAALESVQTIFLPPSYRELSEANRMMFMKKALDEVVLNYNMLSYHNLFRDSQSQQNLNDSIDSSRLRDEQEFNDLFIVSEYSYRYENAVGKLIKGDIKGAQELLFELAEQGVAPACYARALVLFKQLVEQCDVYNGTENNAEIMREGEDDIIEAVELLEFCMDEMKPASNFLVGMMKAFNVGKCSQFIKREWQNDLINVVNVAKGLEGLEFERSVLQRIDSSSKWDTEECGQGMKGKQENIRDMFRYSLYEIVRGMLLEKDFNAIVVSSIFETLSEGDDFPEGLYGYGSTLIRGKIGRDFQKNVEKAMGLLDRARLQEHEGAKLLLGVLPLKREVYCKTQEEVMSSIRILEDYMSKSDDSCSMNKENVDKVALCLAAEYSSGNGNLLEFDEGKIKEILERRNLYEKWVIDRQESQKVPDDNSSLLTPSKAIQNLCSTKNTARISSFSGFASDYSAINDLPITTKLSGTSANNPSALRKCK